MTRVIQFNSLSAAGAFVLIAGGLVAAGWILSVLGCLSALGYAATLVLMVASGLVAFNRWNLRPEWAWRQRRYRRPLPALFLAAWTLVALGALLHTPNNIDAVTYRLPRVLHWLDAGGWHWIDTVDGRQNYSGCGQEWVFAPWLALTGNDRWLGLINVALYGLMPGLCFTTMCGLGVVRKTAWHWMWILPLAPVFVLQAGGTANDLMAAVWFAVALATGIRAVQSRSSIWLLLSVMAMALATTTKATVLPLVLPWLVLLWPRLRYTLTKRKAMWWAGLPVFFLSILPTLVLNHVHTGDWTGDPDNSTQVRVAGPLPGVIGNGIQAVVQNIAPPVFPWAPKVQLVLEVMLGPDLRNWLAVGYPRFSLHLTELAQEEWAGLGGHLLLLIAAGMVLGTSHRCCSSPTQRPWTTQAAGGLAVLAFFALMGSEMTARLLAPYYLLLVSACLRVTAQARWVRHRLFVPLALLAGLLSLIPVVLSPSRPLLPVPALLAIAQSIDRMVPGVFARAEVLYATYARRSDYLIEVTSHLPAATQRVGFMASADDSELSLWRSIGVRSVQRVRPSDTRGELRRLEVDWIVVRADAIWRNPDESQAWLERVGGVIAVNHAIQVKARQPAEHWMLVQIKPTDTFSGG